jgi:uncharacterized membrane protein YphA (DoxX/SURF4 family)
MTINKNLLGIFILLLIFFIGGINKITNIKSTAKGLKNKIKINLPDILYQFIIILVIIFEILAPIIIFQYFITDQGKILAYYSTILLILFTIIATMLYHPPQKQFNIFMKNLSIIGGLLLIKNKLN